MKYILALTCYITSAILLSCSGPSDKSSANDSTTGKDSSASIKKPAASDPSSASFETAQKLLQAIADEMNDGKLDNWSRFYVSAADLEESDIAPLVKKLSNFHGSSTDKAGLARYLLQKAERDKENLLEHFVVQPRSEHRNLYANTFKTTRFSKIRAEKWLSHSGDQEYIYMFDATICFQCVGHPGRHDHSLNSDIVKTPSGWKAASRIVLGHCY